jgi:Arc/MetJ-type ribon-helix-helix transcriptional regulator
MTEESYKKALHDAQFEVTKLLFQRADIDKRLAQLKAAIAAISGLLEAVPAVDELAEIGDVGITEAIRQVLRDAIGAQTPTDIKSALVDRGYDFSRFKNPSAVIHNTLKRLEAQGEVTSVRTLGQGSAYSMAVNPDRVWASLGEGFSKAIAEAAEESRSGWIKAAQSLNRGGGGSK